MPPRYSLTWSQPSIDIAGIWTPLYNEDNVIPPDWSDRHLESTLTRQAPVLTLFGHDDRNRLTFAVSDALNPLKLSARIREEDARIYHAIEFFTEPHPPITEYTVEIRIDTRPVPFYEAIADVADWWASMPAYRPARVPDAAKQPMYSTWYSYHQSIDSESLLAEVDVASTLGFGAIIVDDGWQTTDANRGYAFTGDWQPERLTDIGAFVDAVHARGMKALLWYSLPFVGENAAAAKQFEGKYLRYRESLGAYVLDPRYPEVRQFLIDHYVRAVRDWGWDGLKLDFIDQ
ncbi:MAG: glycoside hydrolase family 36 protein, partial [Pseudomonadota bacterium]